MDMPLQNRISPSGELIRTSARGTLLGNRGGALHNEKQEIVRPCKGQRWITCLLEFRGRSRVVMSPGLYTELFFLDEATALSAGHRPCAECRRQRFNEFREAWKRAGLQPGLAPEMDAVLHSARMDERGGKVTFEAALSDLPDGCFVQKNGIACLVRADALLVWSPDGYRERLRRDGAETVTVLTPEPLVRCLRHGFTPSVHESASK